MHDSTEPPTGDLRGTLPQILKTLRAGRAVYLSDGHRGALIMSALHEPETGGWGEHHNSGTYVLLVRDVASAMDFVINPSPLARRLMKNCWPGAVRLNFVQGLDDDLVRQLSGISRIAAEKGGRLQMSVPRSPLLQELLQQLGFPLVKLDLIATAAVERAGMTVVQSDPLSVAAEAEIHVDGDRWELVRGEGLTAAEVSQLATVHILFVCTGNTCRSPMAEGMFRRMLAERLDCVESTLSERGFDIASAGLSAVEGAPASPEAAEVCRAWGVDLSKHSSQPLTESLLFKSDVVYTMTSGHRQAILSRYPELEEEVQLLSRTGVDVSDPIGWGRAAYEECHREITESLKALVEELAPSQRSAP